MRKDIGNAENTMKCSLILLRQNIREDRLGEVDRELGNLLASLDNTADPITVAEVHVVHAELLLREAKLDDAAGALHAARALLAGSAQSEEVRWEADMTAADLASKRGGEADRATTPQLRTDMLEAGRLHNRPWLLNLQLALAECTFRHDRSLGEALLRNAAVQARAFHADSIAQAAEAELQGHTAI